MANDYRNDPNQQYYQQYQRQNQPPPPRRHSLTWLWVTLAVLACVILLIVWLSSLSARFSGALAEAEMESAIAEPYIAALYVEGEMTVADSSAYPYYSNAYDQQFYLATLDELMEDEHNAGLLLYIDSPGGEVLAADELARKVKQYAETGRPVYAYGYSYAASGAYWLAAAADHITLNKYCLTGSIGVTMGSLVDISGLLENYGVKTYNLASGVEKHAATGLEPITPETLAVYQSIIDEYYADFLSWIAAGRHMPLESVRGLADGRPYTARQALELGLIDEVGDDEAAMTALMEQTGVLPVYDFYPEPETKSLLQLFTGQEKTELSQVMGLLPLSGALAYYDGNW